MRERETKYNKANDKKRLDTYNKYKKCTKYYQSNTEKREKRGRER